MPIRRLLAGYRRFRSESWEAQRDLFLTLAEGQRPDTLVISCSDSRVDPQRVFDVAPGELFVVRNVAALVPPYEPDGGRHGVSAALEFAVNALRVRQIAVMGHGRCGGCAALLEGAPSTCREFVEPWMEIARPAAERARAAPPNERQRVVEFETVKESIANLRSFPWVNERAQAGELKIDGLWFDVRLGELWRLNPDGDFAVVAK